MGNLTITAAKLAEQDGRLAPFAEINGRWYSIETKETLLDAGIVCVNPVTSDLEDDWDAPELSRATLPADPDHGRLDATDIENATTDLSLLILAWKAVHLLARPSAAAGSIL